MELIVDNILDLVDANGEEPIMRYLSAFSCPPNSEIENFLKNRAIDFARRKLSITYLVSDDRDGRLLGYFTLTHKAISTKEEGLSNSARRRWERFARFDKDTGTYMASAFLLAQFGKNYGVDNGRRISGADLMIRVNDTLADIQRRIGGGIVYLECEDEPKLIEFYENEAKYKRYNERYSDEDGIKYLQYIRFF